MRFVATKTPEQQSCLMLHRTRHLFIRLLDSDEVARAFRSRAANPALSPVHGCSWLRIATVTPP